MNKNLYLKLNHYNELSVKILKKKVLLNVSKKKIPQISKK